MKEKINEEIIVKPEYQEPMLSSQNKTNQFVDSWGNLPNARWKNVGRMMQIKVIDESTTLTTGDGKVVFMIPPELDGTLLVRAVAFLSTVSGGGTAVNIQVRNITQSVDMFSTALTIDNSESTSLTATTPVVIKTTLIFRSGDLVAIDVDQSGSGAKGLGVQLSFQ